MSVRDTWRGTCRERYVIKADTRFLESIAPSHYKVDNESIKRWYLDYLDGFIKSALDDLHYEYFEKGERFTCRGGGWWPNYYEYYTYKRVPQDEKFTYVGNVSIFYICNKAIIALSLDKVEGNDAYLTLSITAPCSVVRDFLKHFLFKVRDNVAVMPGG
jgi:hypothetical protein